MAKPIWLFHSLTHNGAAKVAQMIHKWRCENSEKLCKPIATFHGHHPRKTIFVPRGLHPSPGGPFEHLQPVFIHLPPSVAHRYVLVVVRFLGLVKPSLAARPTPSQWQRHCWKMCCPRGVHSPKYLVTKALTSLGKSYEL
ncbi:hypothetical protein HJG60_011593 [Phyllostomus discolor]|uniref:Uncharacterized protein n=1 Tax=Phyllostomus discolor TaxID=89673 RepID=A0A834E0X2_9CHIR|nr:hypothetical protein HJG60_011593 [Phyllostomus discolor]